MDKNAFKSLIALRQSEIPFDVFPRDSELHIRELRCGAEDLSYTRSGQVVVVRCSLPAADSLVLHWEYGGTVDDRICDLHLSDKEYDNVFRNCFSKIFFNLFSY